MKLQIVAIGRLKAEEASLCARYGKRIGGTGRACGMAFSDVVELNESRAASRETRRADEAKRLLAACDGGSVLMALDERGRTWSSTGFADFLRARRDAGEPGLSFLLGGPDGHGEAVRSAAKVQLSIGSMTLPHALARVVLMEQIYRSLTILTGHPYHRDG